MDEAVQNPKPKRERKAKAELDSRTFKDGAIYLFRRADYVKPTWFCRIKVPGAKGVLRPGYETSLSAG